MADGSLIETSFGPVATSGFTSAPKLYSPVRSHAAVAPTWPRFSRCEEGRGVDTPDGTGGTHRCARCRRRYHAAA